MDVYFIRTGESQDDFDELHQRPSSPLSPIGEQEVALVARELVHHQFDAVLSSPLERAKQTAQILISNTQAVVYDPSLVEIKEPSELEGEKKDDRKNETYPR